MDDNLTIQLPGIVSRVLQALNDQGYSAYVVGGCVRDSIMERHPQDWDIATSALPEEICRCFAGEKVLTTGIRHGTVVVVMDGRGIEITTYRIDGDYSDHRRPDEVRFTGDLVQDLSRRDFTINAMAYHPREGLVDPFDGQRDIRRKRIVCVGEPEKRFQEDALRILRALRFASVLGFSVEARTSQAAEGLCGLLGQISQERILAELQKLLCGTVTPVLGYHRAILLQLLPELSSYSGWQSRFQRIDMAPPDLAVRWAILFCTGEEHEDVKLADQVLQRLRCDNLTRRCVLDLLEHQKEYIAPDPISVKLMLNWMGEEAFRQLLDFQSALLGEDVPSIMRLNSAVQILDRVLREHHCWRLEDLDVDGKDLMGLGIAPGKELGDLLSRLLDLVIREQLPNRKRDLLQQANRWK